MSSRVSSSLMILVVAFLIFHCHGSFSTQPQQPQEADEFQYLGYEDPPQSSPPSLPSDSHDENYYNDMPFIPNPSPPPPPPPPPVQPAFIVAEPTTPNKEKHSSKTSTTSIVVSCVLTALLTSLLAGLLFVAYRKFIRDGHSSSRRPLFSVSNLSESLKSLHSPGHGFKEEKKDDEKFHAIDLPLKDNNDDDTLSPELHALTLHKNPSVHSLGGLSADESFHSTCDTPSLLTALQQHPWDSPSPPSSPCSSGSSPALPSPFMLPSSQIFPRDVKNEQAHLSAQSARDNAINYQQTSTNLAEEPALQNLNNAKKPDIHHLLSKNARRDTSQQTNTHPPSDPALRNLNNAKQLNIHLPPRPPRDNAIHYQQTNTHSTEIPVLSNLNNAKQPDVHLPPRPPRDNAITYQETNTHSTEIPALSNLSNAKQPDIHLPSRPAQDNAITYQQTNTHPADIPALSHLSNANQPDVHLSSRPAQDNAINYQQINTHPASDSAPCNFDNAKQPDVHLLSQPVLNNVQNELQTDVHLPSHDNVKNEPQTNTHLPSQPVQHNFSDDQAVSVDQSSQPVANVVNNDQKTHTQLPFQSILKIFNSDKEINTKPLQKSHIHLPSKPGPKDVSNDKKIHLHVPSKPCPKDVNNDQETLIHLPSKPGPKEVNSGQQTHIHLPSKPCPKDVDNEKKTCIHLPLKPGPKDVNNDQQMNLQTTTIMQTASPAPAPMTIQKATSKATMPTPTTKASIQTASTATKAPPPVSEAGTKIEEDQPPLPQQFSPIPPSCVAEKITVFQDGRPPRERKSPLPPLPPRLPPQNSSPKAVHVRNEEQSNNLCAQRRSHLTKLKPLYWDKVRESPERSMVWSRLRAGSFEFDEEMIETLFSYNAASNLKELPNSQPLDTKQNQCILEQRKSQNISIQLRAITMTKEEVCEALLKGEGLSIDHLETLARMVPTSEEEERLKEFTGDVSGLSPAESFLKALLEIPFVFKRVDAMLYKANFEEDVTNIRNSLETLEMACKELKNSRLFLKLLEAVLKTGNRMNDGTFRGEAEAFKLDALLKLADIRGVDGKTTLLHFVVQEIIRSEGMKTSEKLKDNGNNKRTSQNNKEKEVEYRDLGLKLVSGLGTELCNVKKATGIDSDMLAISLTRLSRGLEMLLQFQKVHGSKEWFGATFYQSMELFLSDAQKKIESLREEEARVFFLVKDVTEYFHGNSAKEEAHPLRIFVIVGDFLSTLDKVCKEIGRSKPNALRFSSHRSTPHQS